MANPDVTSAETVPAVKEKSVVKSALRTLTVFEVFAQQQAPLTLSELARALGIPISSCHGLIATLQNEGYLYAFGERRQFYPTKRLLDLATAITRNDPTLELLAPHLEALRDRCGETVILGKRQGDGVLYLDVIEGSQTIRYSANAGDLKPLHSSAIGKAMLGEMDGAEIAAIWETIARPKITANTIVDLARLTGDIAEGRRNGYFITRGENVPDVWAVAKVVRIAGEALGIAIAGPAHRMEKQIGDQIALLQECAAKLETSFYREADQAR